MAAKKKPKQAKTGSTQAARNAAKHHVASKMKRKVTGESEHMTYGDIGAKTINSGAYKKAVAARQKARKLKTAPPKKRRIPKVAPAPDYGGPAKKKTPKKKKPGALKRVIKFVRGDYTK